MSRPHDRALLFRPTQCIQAKGRPVFGGITARIHLVTQTQQDEVP